MARKWKELYRQNGPTIICPYCLKPILPNELSIDHEPPKSRQAELGKSELIYCCKKCNNEKGSLTAEEYKLWKRLNFIRNGGKIR